MDQARDRIASGCQPEWRPEVLAKNGALAVLLDNLFRGQQQVLEFLDNCGLVLSMADVENVQQFATRPELLRPDSDLSRTKGDWLNQAARNLYFRLHPTGQLTDDGIFGNVTEWAFQVLHPAQVPDSDGDPSELSLVENDARERASLKQWKRRRRNECPSKNQEDMRAKKKRRRVKRKAMMEDGKSEAKGPKRTTAMRSEKNDGSHPSVLA